MPLNIKQKIRLGTLFLLLLLVISVGISIYFQVFMTKASKNILIDNYESLEYCHTMQRLLDSFPGYQSHTASRFDSVLTRQENNITEPGEKEATQVLRPAFNRLKANSIDYNARKSIETGINRILQLNMKAIQRKNISAQHSAETAFAVIIAVISLTGIIGLTFGYNFPGIVVTPIRKLMEAIQEISAKNYRYRIHINQKDEFGQLAEAFNTMSERLESFENSNLNKLIFEKARAEAVINSLKDASIGIDGRGYVLFVNQQALELLGLSLERTVGRKAVDVAIQNDLFRYLLENESSAPFKIVVEGKENYYTKETLEVPQNEQVNRVIVLKNITSFKELDTAKTNFIATVSHELKTPLASSDFSLKLLEDDRVGQLTSEQKELVQLLKNDNQRMLRILSELLNMSQVETGKLQLKLQSVKPYPIIDQSIHAISAMAREKSIFIEQQVEENLPEITADADKAGWVLINFLTNAIKFSPNGSTIIVKAEKLEDRIHFSVTDYGAGFNPEYAERVFERYFQVPGRTESKGSGIGLAICKEFIEAMGGFVHASSKPGHGSIFSFNLRMF